MLALRQSLWSDLSDDENVADVRAILTGRPRSTMPLDILVAEVEGEVVGFVEVGLRSHADGCDPLQPCGFVEGWYVAPEAMGRGIGRALIVGAEQWAKDRGCVELASDTWANNERSIEAHRALGFDVVDTCVNFKKRIG